MSFSRLISFYDDLKVNEPSIIRGAMKADFNEVKAALKENPNCISETDPRTGMTALHIATGGWNFELVSFLCDQPGYEKALEIQDVQGRTPVFMAIINGRKDIEERLMRDAVRRIEEMDKISKQDSVGKVSILKPNPPGST